MSYDQQLLFEAISASLRRSPCISLLELSVELSVSRRTIQKVVGNVTGKSFRDLREGILIARVRTLCLSGPSLAIKELSFKLGYQSARSFARAVRRASGVSPQQLRMSLIQDRSPEDNNSFDATLSKTSDLSDLSVIKNLQN